jgi:hypothetical protein
MSYEDELPELVNQLKERGVEFDAGLSDAEVKNIEQTCNFQFPPDLKMFLQLGVPVRWVRANNRAYEGFPNWRQNHVSIMENARIWVLAAFHFDIEKNDFWMERWSERPAEQEAAFTVVDRFLETVPVLIPIFAHRFMPDQPHSPGNPIYSMYQPTDTIYYGYTLQSYLKNEFMDDQEDWGEASDYRQIPFWSDIVS